ncbi:MAG TPA: alanine racemase [Solirubrobacteraceae bacterium]|nr:alanine racemase [Solirubrobacteraceae bacterium]
MANSTGPPGGADTPYASVDLDAVDRNIGRMQDYCDRHGLAFRPHIKTHKLPAVAYAQIRAGAVGITCQKLSEAATMVSAGIEDVLITYPLVGEAKLERLRGLARAARLSVGADSAIVAQGISAAMAGEEGEIDFLVECDTGLGRTGVQTPRDAAELALLVDQLPGLRFAGLMTYPSGQDTPAFFQSARAAIEAVGLRVSRFSGGGTEHAYSTHESPIYTELRAGTYVYGDRACVANGTVAEGDCALRVHATVVSRPTPQRAILDAGSKSLTTDPVEAPGVTGYGLLVGRPEAEIDELYEEHARVLLSAQAPPLAVGDTVTIVPNHACGTTNMQNEVLAHRSGRPIGWWPIPSRGAVR